METKAIERRLNLFRNSLDQKGLDSALITKRENVVYLSGFTGDDSYLVITADKAVLVTDSRYTLQASTEAPLYRVIEYKGKLHEALGKILKELGIKRPGIEDGNLTLKSYREFREAFQVEELAALGDLVDSMRMVKDSHELSLIEEAVRIADEAFEHILGFIKPGVMEIELAAELEYFMKKRGASKASFDIIAASGHRSAMPHGTATEKKLKVGDAITLDYGAVYREYHSDITRTVFLGKVSSQMRQVYETVLKAQLTGIEWVKAGLKGKEVDSKARDFIDGAGYGDCFGHSLGHGVGLEIHEFPRLSPLGDITLKNGMVTTVEPGIYLPGVGGVRIEDVVVVKDQVPAVLTRARKDLIVL